MFELPVEDFQLAAALPDEVANRSQVHIYIQHLQRETMERNDEE